MAELMMNLASLNSLALVQSAMSLMFCPWWMLVLDIMMVSTSRAKQVSLESLGSMLVSSSSWLSKRFDEELRDNTKMKVIDFIKTVRKHYAIDVTVAQVYKAKSFAKIRIQVSIEEKYGKTNVGFDGCHVKGSHPGQILSAVGVDGNNRMEFFAAMVPQLYP
ncbi:unnamed protein product [Prunus armeniaca]